MKMAARTCFFRLNLELTASKEGEKRVLVGLGSGKGDRQEDTSSWEKEECTWGMHGRKRTQKEDKPAIKKRIQKSRLGGGEEKRGNAVPGDRWT